MSYYVLRVCLITNKYHAFECGSLESCFPKDESICKETLSKDSTLMTQCLSKEEAQFSLLKLNDKACEACLKKLI